MSAVPASSILQIILQNLVTDPPDNLLPAARAEGTLALQSRDVAGINVIKPFLQGDLPGHL